jgi:hypothetical protein
MEDSVETVTEDGEVIVEKIADEKPAAVAQEFLGPVSMWIIKGMDMAEPAAKVGLTGPQPAQQSSGGVEPLKAGGGTQISVHTVALPARASKELLLELKAIFETFPGREKVQLKIGEKLLPVKLTISMSPILEKRIDDAVKKYAAHAA